ncbi:MAG TPA: glycosyl hydrolase family 18 protein [Candidatus Limnocylindrales bacterium]|nr:glycosyl hydrolase family 18 protein [Candidatus Limnocylindrales bacterium]
MPVITHRPPAVAPRIAFGAIGLAAILAAQTVGVVTAAGPSTASASSSAAGLEPSIHWEDAKAHARDRISFEPGGRVTVGFTPRASDRWRVGGVAPQRLPAGRLDGKQLRAHGAPVTPAVPVPSASIAPSPSIQSSPQSSTEPSAEPSAPASESPAPDPNIDQPIADPGTVLDATAAAWSPPADAQGLAPQARVDPGALRREVFGFLPYWQLNSSTLRIQYDKISTIAYFGVGTDAAGNLLKRNADGSITTGWSGWTSSRLTSIINAAHSTGTRVVLTVQNFAWNSSGKTRQKALLGSSTARLRLARQIAAAVRDRGADGVNLDFEPLVSGYETRFTALVRTIRAELDKVRKGYQITFDTTGFIGNYPIEAATAPGGADAIFIMGYDYRGSSSSPVGSVAPLSRSGYDIRDTVAAYAARVPASKLILGVPYYGRAWSTSTNLVHATNISGTKYGASSAVIYTTAVPFFEQYGKRYETTEQVAWTVYRREHCTSTYGCVNPWRQLYVDDAMALRAKYDVVNRYNLRGAGIWALGYDGTRPELWGAIQARFITDTVPPTITGGSISAPVFSPNGDGTLDSTTARMTVTALIKWGYRVQAVSGTTLGPNLRSGTVSGKAPTFTWNGMDSTPSVVADGTYRITLWAEDASANRSERAFTVTVDKRAATAAPKTSRAFLTPDGNGLSDTVGLSWTSSEPITGAVRIRDRDGQILRRWAFTSRASWAASWDGRASDGQVVKDGRYTYQVDGRDRAGNRTVANKTILVDRTIRSIRWTDSSFDPRAGQRSQVRIDIRRAAVLTVRIYRGSTLVRTVWTDRSFAAGVHAWNWNGRTAAGAYVSPGTYRVVVWAKSWIGTTWSARSVVVQAH